MSGYNLNFMLAELNYKRIILAILLVVITLALLFGVIWLIFIRSDEPAETPGEVVSPGGILPGTGEGGGGGLIGPGGALPGTDEGEGGEEGAGEGIAASEVAQGSYTRVSSLVDGVVREASLTSSGFNFLSGEDDKFYRLTLDGEQLPLSGQEFPFVENTVWANDSSKVILEYPDGANVVYDFTKNKQTTLPLGLEDPVFDSSSDNIAYKFIGASEDENWLVVSDTENSRAEAIEPIGGEGDKVQVSWSPNNQIVALFHEPIGLSREEVFFIGLKGENFKSLVVEGSNFQGKWSPGGDRILYHVISPENNYNPRLWVADASVASIGSNNFNLGLSTWVDKCVFAERLKVYCAVPIDLPQGAGLYPDLVNNSPDVFYEINLSSGISKLIALPILSEEIDSFQVKKLFISDDKSKLYFWDSWTDGLYYLRLR